MASPNIVMTRNPIVIDFFEKLGIPNPRLVQSVSILFDLADVVRVQVQYLPTEDQMEDFIGTMREFALIELATEPVDNG